MTVAIRVRTVVPNLLVLLPLAVLGQNPWILWWHDPDAPSLGSAAVADVDFDGVPEIVFGTCWNDERIIALNAGDGSPPWDYDTDSYNDASPVIVDTDFDDTLEVIVPASATSTIYCFCGRMGAVEWSTPTGYVNCIDSPPADVEVSVASGMLRLNWSPVIGAVCYRVSAGDQAYGVTGDAPLATVFDTSWSVPLPAPQDALFFRVTACDVP